MITLNLELSEKATEHTRNQQRRKIEAIYRIYDLIQDGINTVPALTDALGSVKKGSIQLYINILVEHGHIEACGRVNQVRQYRKTEAPKHETYSEFPDSLKLMMGINPLLDAGKKTPVPIDYHTTGGLGARCGFSYGVSSMEAEYACR